MNTIRIHNDSHIMGLLVLTAHQAVAVLQASSTGIQTTAPPMAKKKQSILDRKDH